MGQRDDVGTEEEERSEDWFSKVWNGAGAKNANKP